MKVVWEPTDIRSGRRCRKPGTNEVWLIGYLAEVGAPCNRVLISLSDGMVSEAVDVERIAASLNAGRYMPVELIGMEDAT